MTGREKSKQAAGSNEQLLGKSLYFLLAIVLLAAITAASIAIGSRQVEIQDIFSGLRGSAQTIEEAAVVRRIMRTFLAILTGAALALSGALMQGLTRNPLADPGILGVNAGASLAVVIGIAFFGITAADTFIWMAILGASITAALVYALGSSGPDGTSPLKLALAGAAVSIALSSIITAILLPRVDIAGGVRAWLVGGVGGATPDGIVYIVPFLTVGVLLSAVSAWRLNALALGDRLARGLGENLVVARLLAAAAGIVLCAAATAACGPIAFVGLVVPHVCRTLFGTDHRWLLPFCAVFGACFLVAADIVGRVVARPTEIEVGIIAAFLGAPFFIWIVRQNKVRQL